MGNVQPETIRVCSKCGIEKEIDQFYLDVRYKGGRMRQCKQCRNEYMEGYRQRNPLYARSKHLKNERGITLDQYKEMFDAQGGMCAVCEQEETQVTRKGIRRALAVDHCHESGRVRGLLCGRCNRGLGNFDDDSDRLRSAAAYLDTLSGQTDHRTAARPNGAHTDDAGHEPLAGAPS